jgi:rhodanese-related sulfurtransferase
MVTEISREELRQKLVNPGNLVLIEALSPADYQQSHIPGALNIPPEQVYTLAPALIRSKDLELIVYSSGPCCSRAHQVANDLAGLGYYDVRYYAGGKSDWLEAGLPIVKKDQPRVA